MDFNSREEGFEVPPRAFVGVLGHTMGLQQSHLALDLHLLGACEWVSKELWAPLCILGAEVRGSGRHLCA